MKSLLSVRGLTKRYRARAGGGRSRTFAAVDQADLEVAAGECLAVVGESGSGKTTLALSMLRLLEVDEGEILFDGVDLRRLGSAELRKQRRYFQIVFQDSGKALDPRHRIGRQIAQPLVIHRLVEPAARQERVAELLDQVGLPAEIAGRFPHQLSGGQKQRVGIARALASEPRLLVLDEPVSALDVSVQAQILELLADLRTRLELAMVLISHDLAVVEQLADRVLVMYLGRVVESASRRELLTTPQHPYTAGLLASAPVPDPEVRRSDFPPRGEAASFLELPLGCGFHPRCPWTEPICRTDRPVLRQVGDGHAAACHLAPKSESEPA